MVKVTAAEVNNLRKITGAGMMDCKKALVEANGDLDSAIEILRKKGQKVAAKRADRESSEGVAITVANQENTTAIGVVLACETDFVGKNADFIELAHKIANTALSCKSKEELLKANLGEMTVEEKLIEQLVEMFRNMGMHMDKEQIRGMMEQFRSQFENMGLDAEKIAKGDVNFNFDLSQLAKMFQSGKSMEDILSNLGMDIQVDASPVEIKAPEVKESLDDVINIPANDVYLDGWNMAVTVDFTLRGDVEESELELELVRKGNRISVIKDTKPAPLAQIELPHPCEDLVDWSLNNGILDITLKLTPQGSAVDNDDETVEAPDVSIDVGDSNDDDDEDDGGIPIF